LLNQIAAIHGTGVAASTTSYESIQTVTVGAGGSSSISFTSIPSTYKHLQVRYIARSAISDVSDNIWSRFNSDTGSNYTYHLIEGTGSSVSAGAGSSQTRNLFGRCAGNTASSNVFGAAVIDILDYSDTNKFTTIRNLAGDDNNGNGSMRFESGLWRNTAAVNALTITTNASDNFLQYSQFALYGIKG
jgi:hypothetical protein